MSMVKTRRCAIPRGTTHRDRKNDYSRTENVAKAHAAPCKWVRLCGNAGTQTVRHPALGTVLMCADCAALYGETP